MRSLAAILIFHCVFSCPAYSASEKLYTIAPTMLPNTTREMKTPGFWISRHPSPDKVIMSSEEIRQFNADLEQFELTRDLLQIPKEYPGEKLRATLAGWLKDFKEKKFFGDTGGRAPEVFYHQMEVTMNLPAIPEVIKIRYGFVARFTNCRFFPTPRGLYEKPQDIDFDELQNSDFDVGTPLVILHESEDRRWFYALTDNSEGWVWMDDVAPCTKEQMKDFLYSRPPNAVVVSAKADIFLDKEMTRYHDYARMGTSFPIVMSSDQYVVVNLPLRDEDGRFSSAVGYFKKGDVHEDYLPYTARHILNQAFKLLNEPYGWGGLNGEQDCSRFLHEVFSTVGIRLPRNSKEQAKAGHVLARFNDKTSEAEKLAKLKDALGGISILPMKGHIMLYLGTFKDRPYAIHATWGYREKDRREDRVRVINRVVVTDLSLGEGSQKGSLLNRLSAIVVLEK